MKLVDEIKVNDKPVNQMASDIQTNKLYVTSDNSINIWTQVNGKWTFDSTLGNHEKQIHKLKFFGDKLYSGDEGGEVIGSTD